jgi:hypothetical protein
VTFLVEHMKAKVSLKDAMGRTALDHARECDKEDVVEYLSRTATTNKVRYTRCLAFPLFAPCPELSKFSAWIIRVFDSPFVRTCRSWQRRDNRDNVGERTRRHKGTRRCHPSTAHEQAKRVRWHCLRRLKLVMARAGKEHKDQHVVSEAQA